MPMQDASVRARQTEPRTAADPKALKPSGPSRVVALAGVGLVLVCATLVAWLLDRLLEARIPMAVYALAVAAIAWWRGWGYALLTTLAGAVLGAMFHHQSMAPGVFAIRLATYLLASGGFAWIAVSFKRKLDQAHEQLARSLAQLQVSEKRLQMALSAGGLMAWETDLRTGHTVGSEHAEQLWGFRSGEPEDFTRQIHPDDLERTLDAWQRVQHSDDGEYATAYRVLRPAGVRWYESRGRVVRDSSGVPSRLVGVTADLTPRHEAEDHLRQSEARFRHLANAMPQIVWVADANGQVNYMNARWEAYTGMPADQALGDAWTQAVHPDEIGGQQQHWHQCLREGLPYEDEVRLRMADGNYRWFALRARPIHADTGRLVSWYGSAMDIDDLQRMSKALVEADRHKDEFLATLAHELRNPLAPLRSGLSLVKLRAEDPITIERTAQRMERQLVHLTRLVDDLLDVSRISRGTIELRLGEVDLCQVVHDALEISRPLIEERRHVLTLDLPAQGIRLQGDAGRLTQAVSNLLNNAARYTDVGGCIRVRLAPRAGGVELSVEDNGIGIPPQMREAVFKLFTQVRSSRMAQDGLGIGLNIVQKIVNMHGGTVRADAASPQGGSRFVVWLPLGS